MKKITTKVSSYFPNDGTDFVHFHEHPYLSFVINGGGIFQSKSLICERLPGNLVFSYAGELHRCVANEFPTTTMNLEVGLDLLRKNRLTEAALAVSVGKNPNAKLLMLKTYSEVLSKDVFTSSSIEMLLIDLIVNTRTAKGRHPLWTNRVDELMRDRWNEPLSLNDLANAAGVHPVTVSKYFRTYFGCTFGEYMRRLRIEKSLSLIKISFPISLTDIALQCGFYDQSHFCRTFRQLTGFSPRSYAKL